MDDDRPHLASELMYRPESNTYRVEFRYGTNPPSLVVSEAVAELTDREPDDLAPLFETIDPDALDALFAPSNRSVHRGDGTISFAYEGHDVTVKSYGFIEIRPIGMSAEPPSSLR